MAPALHDPSTAAPPGGATAAAAFPPPAAAAAAPAPLDPIAVLLQGFSTLQDSVQALVAATSAQMPLLAPHAAAPSAAAAAPVAPGAPLGTVVAAPAPPAVFNLGPHGLQLEPDTALGLVNNRGKLSAAWMELVGVPLGLAALETYAGGEAKSAKEPRARVLSAATLEQAFDALAALEDCLHHAGAVVAKLIRPIGAYAKIESTHLRVLHDVSHTTRLNTSKAFLAKALQLVDAELENAATATPATALTHLKTTVPETIQHLWRHALAMHVAIQADEHPTRGDKRPASIGAERTAKQGRVDLAAQTCHRYNRTRCESTACPRLHKCEICGAAHSALSCKNKLPPM
jgi:hypothetical protein